MIEDDRGTHFDPVVVDAFCQVPEAEWQLLRDRVAAGTPHPAVYDTPTFALTGDVS